MSKLLSERKRSESKLVGVVHKPASLEDESIVKSHIPRLLGRRHARGGRKGKFIQEPSRPLFVTPEGSALPILYSLDDQGEMVESQSVSIARSLVDPRTSYTFRMVAASNISSSAGGVIALAISCSPTTTTFQTYSSLSALFTEVRLVGASLSLFNQDPHSDGYSTGPVKSVVAISYNDSYVNTTPGSVLGVLEDAQGRYHSLSQTKVDIFNAKVPRDREYADVASPAPGPYAGCTGQFSLYNSGLTASTIYMVYHLVCDFEFRNRA